MAAARLDGAAPLGPIEADPDAEPDAEPVDSDPILAPKQPRNPISRTRIEVVASRSVAGVGVVFALQAMPVMFAQVPVRMPVMGLLAPVILGLSLIAVVVAAVIKVGVRASAGTVALVYLAALLAWPFLMRDPTAVLEGKPWLWYMCTIATACAALAFPVLWAVIYTLVVPTVYGVVRSTPSGGNADLLLSSLDAVYAIILGQVILIIIFMLRQTALAVDNAQTNALHQYGNAVRQHATEVERVQVDSIVHDSVLATFLAAAAAGSPKAAELAAGMASDALTRLNAAAIVPAGDDSTVPFSELSAQIRAAADRLPVPFTVDECAIDGLRLPVHASEAILAGSMQAMVNSAQHAGTPSFEPDRTLTISGNGQGGCTITVADTGLGFDPLLVPAERLGLRLSIQDRVVSAGGAVRVCSEIGRGTTITIEWPPAGEGRPE